MITKIANIILYQIIPRMLFTLLYSFIQRSVNYLHTYSYITIILYICLYIHRRLWKSVRWWLWRAYIILKISLYYYNKLRDRMLMTGIFFSASPICNTDQYKNSIYRSEIQNIIIFFFIRHFCVVHLFIFFTWF